MRYIISSPMASTLTCLVALSTGMAMAEGVPDVVTDVPPVHALVSAVMGDLGTPLLLLAPGASEHHFQLRPSQANAIASADLVVLIGPELTPWLSAPLSLRPEGAPELALLSAKETLRRDYAGEEGEEHAHDHDHGHDHDHDHDHEAHAGDDHAAEEGHGHSHDGTDPHAWLDPANGKAWLGLIAAELSRLDPENAATYEANALAEAERITTAEAEAAAILAPVRDKPFATFHDAFGYYTGHFGLANAGSVALGDAGTPGARHLQELRARVEAGEILCLFPEAGHDPALLERVAEGSGVRIGGLLDPVGAAMEPGQGLYRALLTETAATLADCLKG